MHEDKIAETVDSATCTRGKLPKQFSILGGGGGVNTPRDVSSQALSDINHNSHNIMLTWSVITACDGDC